VTPVLEELNGSPIQSVQIETTSRCNLHCKTCLKPVYRKSWQQRDMDQALFARILLQIKDYKPDVHLQGWGEPLIQRKLLSFVQQLKSERISTSFTTNGTIMSQSLAKSRIESGVDGVTFSMAGGCSLTQDSLRGDGTFALLQSAITTLIDVRKQYEQEAPLVAISYLLTPGTVQELPKAVSWCNSVGVDAFSTVFLTQSGGVVQKALAFLPSKEEAVKYRFLRIKSNLSAFFGRMRLNLKPFHPTLTPVCDKNPLNNIFINANGDVSPCVFLAPPVGDEIIWQHSGVDVCQRRFVLGNLKELTLKEIWETDEYETFREKFRQRKEYYEEKLSTVSCLLSGCCELETARDKIQNYFISHSAPKQCLACAKLKGY
jgi:MoaA/NifB/PqqE/SkfB family radical SAM enzyme